jgi:hypothetical protein
LGTLLNRVLFTLPMTARSLSWEEFAFPWQASSLSARGSGLTLQARCGLVCVVLSDRKIDRRTDRHQTTLIDKDRMRGRILSLGWTSVDNHRRVMPVEGFGTYFACCFAKRLYWLFYAPSSFLEDMSDSKVDSKTAY